MAPDVEPDENDQFAADYLESRAERGKLVNIDAIFAKIPTRPAIPGDELL